MMVPSLIALRGCLFFVISSRERIFIVISGRDFEVPDSIACIALRESVRISDFGDF